jgi:hypothetical protein
MYNIPMQKQTSLLLYFSRLNGSSCGGSWFDIFVWDLPEVLPCRNINQALPPASILKIIALAEFCGESDLVALADVPPTLIDAIISTEDARFTTAASIFAESEAFSGTSRKKVIEEELPSRSSAKVLFLTPERVIRVN